MDTFDSGIKIGGEGLWANLGGEAPPQESLVKAARLDYGAVVTARLSFQVQIMAEDEPGSILCPCVDATCDVLTLSWQAVRRR